ncbi:MAG: hypothetical protein ACFE8O_11480, partial [Candidatus Hermodarchaeota archaeon]
ESVLHQTLFFLTSQLIVLQFRRPLKITFSIMFLFRNALFYEGCSTPSHIRATEAGSVTSRIPTNPFKSYAQYAKKIWKYVPFWQNVSPRVLLPFLL